MIADSAWVTVSDDLVASDLEDGTVILNLKSGIYYGLNQMGSVIWKLVQAPIRIAEIREALLAEYDVDAERCQRELLALVKDMASSGLVKITDEP
ncbi:MAG: PqqD family protein [Chloroflexi bacterium]|nr:PqqD family protein [Chloroflexota bacterium]